MSPDLVQSGLNLVFRGLDLVLRGLKPQRQSLRDPGCHIS